jgi:predicted transglutaminase-like cysteine proteinase
LARELSTGALAVLAVSLTLGLAILPRSAQAASLADAVAQIAARPQAPAPSNERAFTGLFGSRESRPGPLQELPQWQRVIADHAKDAARLQACLDAPEDCRTPYQNSWRQVIDAARGKEKFEILAIVNSFFNQWSYSLDEDLYGKSEYWATPYEFLTRSGDCEDYAIAKYFALRDLGFPEEDLRIVILFDSSRGIGHAVLTVRHGQDQLVLDSLSDGLFSHRRYSQYRPQFSMNETQRWRHEMPAESRPKVVYEGLLALRPE